MVETTWLLGLLAIIFGSVAIVNVIIALIAWRACSSSHHHHDRDKGEVRMTRRSRNDASASTSISGAGWPQQQNSQRV